MARPPHILLAAGGTGGHVYPAIAIADAIRDAVPGAVIAFAGTRERIEWEKVPQAGYPIHPIRVRGLHRSQPWRNAMFPLKLMQGMRDSWLLVARFDPDVVIGTGGFVSGPVLLAAHLRRRPIVIQEQNAYAGLTNRLLARWAARIHVAFVEAKAYLPPEKCVFSGNPTRASLAQADSASARRFFGLPLHGRVLLAFGGSLGSQALNDAMEQHIGALLQDDAVHVLWQTGSRYYGRLRARVSPHPRLRLMEYVDRMDLAYAAADVALCRAGAITCSELMITATPSILVPSPNVAEDHQTKNAESMVRAGAAVLLREEHLRESLTAEVTALLADGDRRAEMATRARQLARPDAARRVAEDVLGLARHDRHPRTDVKR